MALQTFFVVLSVFLLLHSPTTSGLLAVQTGACRYRKFESPGDVKLLVLAGLHESDGDGCGPVSKSVAPLVLAVEWALAILNGERGENNDPYIPGLKIGYDLYDTCDSVAMTTDILYTGSRDHVDCSNMTENIDIYLGSISLTTDESTLVISRLIRDLPVMRPLPSSPLLDHSGVTNLFQTVVSFQREAKAIVDALRASDWTFVAIFHSSNTYGKQTAREMQAMMKEAGICVSMTGPPDEESLQKFFGSILNKQMFNQTATVVFLGNVSDALRLVKATQRPSASRISWAFTSHVARHPEVKSQIQSEDHYVSVEYVTFNDNEYGTYLNEVKNGNINTTLSDFAAETTDYSRASVDLVVDAVTALVHGAKRLRSLKCPDGSSGVCDDFTNSLNKELVGVVREGVATDAIGNRSVQFTSSGNRDNVLIEVRIHSARTSPNSNLVGVDENGGYTQHIANGKLPTSACASQCAECVKHLDMRYSYLHGDVLILGLFSLHTYGDSPFSCGEIRREINDPITVSAFMEAIKLKRTSTNKLYGGLAIDDCYLAMNTTNFLGDLFSKKLIITDPQTGSAINFDNVVLIVGALSSSVTVVVADLATDLGLPMISYSASSPELDNRIRYPYFRRTVPSDSLQAKGIVELIASLNVTRVGAVYIDDSYGKAGITQLLEYAQTQNICVVEPISVTQEDSPETLEINVVKKLYDNQVRVVVFFAFDSIALKIADILKKDAYNSQPLIFVASEGWGTNQKLIESDIGMTTKGSIVFNIGATSMEMQWYKTFLQNLTAASSVNNKWIPTFFEDYFTCNFMSSFEKKAAYNHCSDAKKREKLDTAMVGALVTDQRAVHTALTVSATVDAYEQFCRTVTVCSPIVSRRHPSSLMSAISDVKIDDRKLFDGDGNGNIGYTIFNIQMDRVTFVITYERIGTYTKDGHLALSSNPVFYNDYDKEIPLASIGDTLYCDYSPKKDQCTDVCLAPVPMPTTTKNPGTITTAPDNNTDTTLLIVVIITGILALVLAAALILVVCLLLRRSNALYEMSKQVSVHDRGARNRQSQDNIYHTPSDSVQSINKNRTQSGKYDNPAFEVTSVTPVSGSSRSSMELKPIQYAAISQTSLNIPGQSTLSLPAHSRQWSDLGPGPQSPPEWADLNRPRKRPGAADQMDDFRSTRSLSPAVFTPNSAPVQPSSSRSTQDQRARALSSPRFRFSHLRGQEQSLTDDDPRCHQEIRQCDGRGSNDYLAPGPGNGAKSEEDSKITYLSAKDFVNTSGDDEEEEESLPFSALSTSLTIDSEGSGGKSIGYDPNLISPSNDEIIGINYPSEQSNTYHRVPRSFKPAASRSPERSKASDSGAFIDSLGDSFPESPVDEGVCIDDMRVQVQGSKPVYDDNLGAKSNPRGYRGGDTRSPGVSSISDVPDIIKHRAYEEENVFII